MAHEGLVLFLFALCGLLLMGFYFGPNREIRQAKRDEGKIMMIPSAILLFILSFIIMSGILS